MTKTDIPLRACFVALALSCLCCHSVTHSLTPFFVRHGMQGLTGGRANQVTGGLETPSIHPQVHRRYKDPVWRPCLSICVDGCSSWEGYELHLRHCAESCIKYGLKAFNPEKYCFELARKRR